MNSTPEHPEQLLRVPANGGLDPQLCLAVLAAHAIPGIDEQRGEEHRRPVRIGGRNVVVALRFTDDAVLLRSVDSDLTAADRSLLTVLVRHWFALDVDLEPINAQLLGDPTLAPLVTKRPRLRPVGYPDPFEAAATTVLGQQVSLAAMRTFAGRLVSGWAGPPIAGWHLFPDPGVVAGVAEDELRAAVGLTHARTRTLLAVAEAFARTASQPRTNPGDFPLTRDELLAIRGIGPWSADYLDVRARLDPDAFTAGDLVLRRALGGVTAQEAAGRAEAWRPYRGHALFHLWSEEAYAKD
ncbi:DNA-3-methyladenine glycosylase family protein [Arthrobacter rhombi]|uniref:DNA-3-methyladenine glycosylase family protein n=1 Tax=Arthrobacter rhombi TaxID=71253 RepID=UPI003F916CFB